MILVYHPEPDTEPLYRWHYEEYLRRYPEVIRVWMAERGIPYRLGPCRLMILPGPSKNQLPVRAVIFDRPSDELRYGEEFIAMINRDIETKDPHGTTIGTIMLFRMAMRPHLLD